MNEWISVKDRLPEEDKPYIISYRSNDEQKVVGAFWDSFEGYNQFTTDEGLIYEDVTHWMPLPNPPKQ